MKLCRMAFFLSRNSTASLARSLSSPFSSSSIARSSSALGAKDARAGWSLERVMREATEAIANDGVTGGTGGNIDSGGEKRRPWASRAFDARVQSRDDALGDAEGRKRRRKA
mgnify:CR=1 FL=1